MASLTDLPFVPVHVRIRAGDSWRVESIPVWGGPPTEPFFAQTVERWLTRPASLLFRRIESAAELEGRVAHSDIRVAGLIMHMSHSGSTLVAQALALRARTVVLSEPSFLDPALSPLRPGDTLEDRARFVRSLVIAAALPFLSEGGDVVLKAEAPHVSYLPLLRLAFPNAPWTFLHRRPESVCAANTRDMPGGLLPGRIDPSLFGLAPDLGYTAPFEIYAAHLVAALGRTALAYDGVDRGLFVDHDSLDPVAIERIAGHFDLALDEATRARIAERLTRDAKNPRDPFERRSAEVAAPVEVVELLASVRAALVARTDF